MQKEGFLLAEPFSTTTKADLLPECFCQLQIMFYYIPHQQSSSAKILEWASPHSLHPFLSHSVLKAEVDKVEEDNTSWVSRRNLLHDKWDAVESDHA